MSLEGREKVHCKQMGYYCKKSIYHTFILTLHFTPPTDFLFSQLSGNIFMFTKSTGSELIRLNVHIVAPRPFYAILFHGLELTSVLDSL